MNKARSRFCSLKTLALLSFVIISNWAVAQNRPPQNIRRVTVLSQYVVENGTYKSEFYPVKQEMYDSLGRLHTEIDWSLKDHYPHDYRWHTFDGKLKIKTESFINEKPWLVEDFTYNKDSLVIRKTIKKATSTDATLFLTLNYKYDLKRNPIEVTAQTPNGKTAYISKSTFDLKGKELTRIVKAKSTFVPQDSILKLTGTPIYDSIGRLRSEQLIINMVNKIVVNKTLKYTYDKNNCLIGLVEYGENGKQVRREERDYTFSRNRLSITRYYDSNNIMVKMTGMRYEIYRTSNRRIREMDY